MRYLLLYKGSYGNSLRGPELRYVSLAENLAGAGHKVTLPIRNPSQYSPPDGVKTLNLDNPFSLLKAFLTSDVLILHGGGPLIIIYAIISGLIGKKLILDSYVPHWIELCELAPNQSKPKRLKFLAKSYFNSQRTLFGLLFFDTILVANTRQMDLTRGFISPHSLTDDFEKIVILPFGCSRPITPTQEDQKNALSRLSNGGILSSDFVVGWLGGTYGWFDFDSALNGIIDSISQDRQIKLVLFGISASEKESILNKIPKFAIENIIFLPWVDFTERHLYWKEIDISIVWGRNSYENDYASRTRNFDCLTLGLPIIQNEDGEWSDRLKRINGGVVVTEDKIAETIRKLKDSPSILALMKDNLVSSASDFSWDEFTRKLIAVSQSKNIPISRKLFGLLSFLTIIPSCFLFITASAGSILINKNRNE